MDTQRALHAASWNPATTRNFSLLDFNPQIAINLPYGGIFINCYQIITQLQTLIHIIFATRDHVTYFVYLRYHYNNVTRTHTKRNWWGT